MIPAMPSCVGITESSGSAIRNHGGAHGTVCFQPAGDEAGGLGAIGHELPPCPVLGDSNNLSNITAVPLTPFRAPTGSGPEPVPVAVAVVGDELDVRPALGHATDEGEVTAYGPQP